MRTKPAVAGPSIWITDCAGGVSRHFRANGKVYWRSRVPKGIHGEPRLIKGRLIFGCDDGYVYCYDAISGAKRWRRKTGKREVYAPPAYAELGTEKRPTVLIGSLNRSLLALELDTGKVRWSFKTGATISAEAHVIGEHIYVASFDGKIYRLDHDGKQTGELELKDKLYAMTAPSPAGITYLTGYDGQLFKVDLKAMAVVWAAKTGKMPACVPAIGDGRVFVGTWEKTLYAYSAADGKQLWTHKGNNKFYNSPMLHAGRLYAGNDDGTLYCLDPASGKVHWTYKLSSAVRTEMQVVDGRLICGTRHGHVYVLRLPETPGQTPPDPHIPTARGAKRYY